MYAHINPFNAFMYSNRLQTPHLLPPVAKFVVPDWGIKSSCRTGQPAYVAWQAGTTTLCKNQLYPPQSETMNWASL